MGNEDAATQNDHTDAPAALSAIVLAAGEGSRMRSERPKPLHRLCGKPMLMYVVAYCGLCNWGIPVGIVF